MAKVTKEMKQGSKAAEETPAAASLTHTFVANQHTAPIIFPRAAAGGVAVNPLVLPPGTVTPVPKEEWELYRSLPATQHYLDAKLIEERGSLGAVPVLESTSADLESLVPDNLKNDVQPGAGSIAAGSKLEIKGEGAVEVK